MIFSPLLSCLVIEIYISIGGDESIKRFFSDMATVWVVFGCLSSIMRMDATTSGSVPTLIFDVIPTRRLAMMDSTAIDVFLGGVFHDFNGWNGR